MLGFEHAGTFLLTASSNQPAPAPIHFSTAKTVFLAKDDAVDETEDYHAYQKLYRALAARQFQIVDMPAKADLNLGASLVQQRGERNFGQPAHDAVLRLQVRNTKTGLLIWTLNENVESALRESTFEKNLDTAITQVFYDWDALAVRRTRTMDSQEPPATYPHAGKTHFSQKPKKQLMKRPNSD